MDYKIKDKVINGEVKYGLINDKLEVALPFKYTNIEKKTYERKGMYESSTGSYYILSNSDNKKGIFLAFVNGAIIIEPAHDYIEYIPGYGLTFIVGQLVEGKMEYGILERKFNGDDSYTDKMVYPFGKADKIKLENDKVVLYKNKGDRVLKGVFNDPQLGTCDPKYIQLDLCIGKPQIYPIMPDPKHVFADKGVKWAFSSEQSILYIKYSKIKNRKEVKGILVSDIKYDGYSSSRNQTIWNELVPCEYSDCSIDTTENLINLSQRKNKKELKGLMGFSTYWNIYTKGALVIGNCTYIPEFTIPCEYDSISLFVDRSDPYERKNKEKYFLVEKNGKFGLLKVCYSLARGPYDRYGYNPVASVEVLLECKCDSISKCGQGFIFTIDGKNGLLVDRFYDKDGKVLQTDCEYKSIHSISNVRCRAAFEITDFNDKKSVFALNNEKMDLNRYLLSMI